jgi:hypothetical protein
MSTATLTSFPSGLAPSSMELVVHSSGADERRVVLESASTGAELREKLAVDGNTRLYYNNKVIKATDTLESVGVHEGSTIKLYVRSLGEFTSRAEQQAAHKLQAGAIRRSTAHKHLHGQTQAVVHDRADRAEAKLDAISARLDGHPPSPGEGETEAEVEIRLHLAKAIITRQLREVAPRAAEARRVERQRAVQERRAQAAADRAAVPWGGRREPRPRTVTQEEPKEAEIEDAAGQEEQEEPKEAGPQGMKTSNRRRSCGECVSCLHPKRRRGCLKLASERAEATAPPPVDARTPLEHEEARAMGAADVEADTLRLEAEWAATLAPIHMESQERADAESRASCS